MPYTIHKRREAKRGCGWRKGGGLYLISDGLPTGCGKLPLPLVVCPTCGHGIKPSRGWTWVNATALLDQAHCKAPAEQCSRCPFSKPIGRAGLLWIGGAYYKTVDSFLSEVDQQGISRRISTVPRGFEVGKTWVLLAHRKVIRNADDSMSPGIFRAFVPQAIEYVVKPDDDPEKLERLAARGITLVEVERIGEPKPLFANAE